ncbi:MAG TPA: PfkB family carbohydrate kinase [bacterium]|nr:PfkB family carbohydrate kinase [bacterium]HQQ00378.1 PfkB family carbohydrate kinase [bacterium]
MSKPDLVIVGSVALDSIRTPHGERSRVLGGAATYSAVAASLLCRPGIVGVIGRDFPEEHRIFLEQRGIDLEGLDRKPGETFHWKGRYEGDMNAAITEDTQLGVFAEFSPTIPASYREADYLFLGNIHPQLQLDVLDQMKPDVFAAADTMNLWINTTHELLQKVIRRVHLMLLNDAEARAVSGRYNLLNAAEEIRRMGPSIVVIKKGEHGAMVFSEHGISLIPAVPLSTAKDPTGAGDTFAGGMVGYLTKFGIGNRSELAGAALMGAILASFTVENFSVTGLATATPQSIAERKGLLQAATQTEMQTLA